MILVTSSNYVTRNYSVSVSVLHYQQLVASRLVHATTGGVVECSVPLGTGCSLLSVELSEVSNRVLSGKSFVPACKYILTRWYVCLFVYLSEGCKPEFWIGRSGGAAKNVRHSVCQSVCLSVCLSQAPWPGSPVPSLQSPVLFCSPLS